MSVSRAQLVGGPAKVTWNGMTLFSREDIGVDFDQTWQDLLSSAHGVIDKVSTDRQIKVNMRLWGAWESAQVAKLFPTAYLNPVVGTRIYGTVDLPLVILKKTGIQEQITIHNAQLTGLSNLYLGVDNPIFAADVEFTGLIKGGASPANPEDPAAYYTIGTGVYADTSFSKLSFAQQRYSASWVDNDGATAIDGFAAFQAHKGWNISWGLNLQDEYNANVGTVDKILMGVEVSASCIPLGPTLAQISTALMFQDAGRPLGSLLSGHKDGTEHGALTITGTDPSVAIVIKGASMSKMRPSFGSTPLLNGEVTWMATRLFTGGTPGAYATAA